MKPPVVRWIVLAVTLIAVAIAIHPAIRYYRYFVHHVSTDDAYVDGTVALVSSRIAGTVTAVYVDENWTVKRGNLLVELDPRDFQVRVNRAQAQLARAKQTVDQLFAQLDAAQAGLQLAESQQRQTKIDFQRASTLLRQHVASKEFYDQATTAYRVAQANVALARHEAAQAQAALGGTEDHSRYDRPIVQQAEATLTAANLDLAYTKITAPFDGIVSRKSVHVGNRVQPGEPLMAVVPTERLYITANYKETQLTGVRVGQPADIEADIYPGYVYHGHVDSISVGTGSAFALLPPENATGNWVKVVQRVPVKIVLDQKPPPGKPLRLGLSVEVAIDTSNTKGPLLSSTLQRRYQQGGKLRPDESLPVPPLPQPGDLTNGGQRPDQPRLFGPLPEPHGQLRP